MSYREIIIVGDHIKLIPLGDCACGCGGKTTIQTKTIKKRNLLIGRPSKYIHNHHLFGHGNPRWKGGKKTPARGYTGIKAPHHPRVNQAGYVQEHILIAEKALGNFLPIQSWVHHVNLNPNDNTPTNLVICEDWGYHMILHRRTRAYYACGHASWHKCKYCGEYDKPINMVIPTAIRRSAYHRVCHALYEYQRRTVQKSDAKY